MTEKFFSPKTSAKGVQKSCGSEFDLAANILNALGQWLLIIRADRTIEYQSESLKKYSGDFTGKKCHMSFYNSTEKCDFCPLDEVLGSLKMQTMEAAFPDGRHFDVTLSPFTDKDNSPKAIVLLKDNTERKAMEAQAIHAAHLMSLGELVAGIAHEINNPVAGIISLAEVLKSRCDKRGEHDEIPERIISDGMRIARVIQDLLSFAREEKNEHDLTQIRNVLFDTLRLVERQIFKDGTKIHIDFPSGLPELEINIREIQYVFLNILSNARYALNTKYQGNHKDKILKIAGEVIKADKRQYIRTTFFDTGSGIPPSILEDIRKPFFSSKPSGLGTGLGLSISDRIIKKHDGRLLLESKEGKYTRVIVDLPIDG